MKRVLILEDDMDLAKAWEAGFNSIGWSPDLVLNINAANKMLEAKNYDAVIVDMFIRDASGKLLSEGGLSLIAKLYKSAILSGKKTPLRVAVTGVNKRIYFDYDPLETALNMEVEVVLRKPFTTEELLETVQNYNS